MKIALVTNMPAPYRVPAWNLIGEKMRDDFLVLFCTGREPNRQWDVPEIRFRHDFLKENYRTKKDRTTFVHNNRDVWKHLKQFGPDVVITGGFNPTMLYAFLYTRLYGKKHIPMSDAWALSEKHLSAIHRMLRKIVYASSQAFIACSVKGTEYFKSYRIREETIFISHYTIESAAFSNTIPLSARQYDLLFSGQFIRRKNPDFFIQVAGLVRQEFPRLRVLLLGDGPLKEEMLEQLQKRGIDYEYPGYAKQKDLPFHFSRSKLFLFPTEYDAWGVVAHESLAAGTPVLISPNAGCSGELVRDNHNGRILPIKEDLWARACLGLLQDKQEWEQFSSGARETAARFTHRQSAEALIHACEYSCNPVP